MADAPAPEIKPIVTTDEQNLVVSFLQFIRQKVAQNQCSPDQVETLEVAIQCLEHAFNLNDASYAFQPSKSILEVFKTVEGESSASVQAEPTDAEKAEANKLKEIGNDFMKNGQFEDAVSKYNEAIKLNRDPVYFCNRAAAYCRLEQYDLAIQDCRTALALDATYSKAWGRMGLAFSCQNRYEQAADAYKKALEIDPTQETYQNNLKIAEEKIKELETAQAANPGAANPFGGAVPNLGAMFNNPNMMNFAQQMMNDPNITTMMNNLMTGNSGLGDIMAMGQRMAQQMQETNPALFDQLREQFGPGGAPPGPGDQPPQPPPSS